jgi:hypothetical protein
VAKVTGLPVTMRTLLLAVYICTRIVQGCQIFLGTTYQKGENVPNYHKIIQNGPEPYQNVVKYSKYIKQYIPRSSKIYPNRDFWFENMPSANPSVSSPLWSTYRALDKIRVGYWYIWW